MIRDEVRLYIEATERVHTLRDKRLLWPRPYDEREALRLAHIAGVNTPEEYKTFRQQIAHDLKVAEEALWALRLPKGLTPDEAQAVSTAMRLK